MTSQPRRDREPAPLTEDELATVSGGPTEELFGNYNFLLEVGGTGSGPAAGGFKPPLGNGKGS